MSSVMKQNQYAVVVIERKTRASMATKNLIGQMAYLEMRSNVQSQSPDHQFILKETSSPTIKSTNRMFTNP